MQQDLDLLKKQFEVRVVNVCLDVGDIRGTLATPLRLILGIAWANAIFCWFASREAFLTLLLSRIYNKKTAVAVGGADVTAIPELGYGAALDKKTHFYQKFVLRRAAKVLPDSRDAEKGALGLTANASKVELIYLGIDTQKFHAQVSKKDIAITVGVVNHSNLKRKGFETFVKSAAYLPNIEFVLIGRFADNSIRYLRSIAPRNVKFTGFLREDELIKSYQEAKVYVQVSAHEAFGAALAEAMASECVPVVTDKGAIPEVVGGAGIYVPYQDPMATAEGIARALKSDKGTIARQRIEKMFSIEKRQEGLINAIRDLLN